VCRWFLRLTTSDLSYDEIAQRLGLKARPTWLFCSFAPSGSCVGWPVGGRSNHGPVFSELTYAILADGELAGGKGTPRYENHIWRQCSRWPGARGRPFVALRTAILEEVLARASAGSRQVGRPYPGSAGLGCGATWPIVAAMLALGAAVSQWFDQQRIPENAPMV